MELRCLWADSAFRIQSNISSCRFVLYSGANESAERFQNSCEVPAFGEGRPNIIVFVDDAPKQGLQDFPQTCVAQNNAPDCFQLVVVEFDAGVRRQALR